MIFQPELFGPGIRIQEADYQMAALDGGLKYQGYALEGEAYYRWVDDLRGPGTDALGFDTLRDFGFQLMGSAMLLPEKLQLYVGGSVIFGEYGDPWDLRVGANWFPFENKTLRWNNELIYLRDSPVGGLAYPYAVGGTGVVFQSNLEIAF